MTARYCLRCGAPALADDDLFCGQCGAALGQVPMSQPASAAPGEWTGQERHTFAPPAPIVAAPYGFATGPEPAPSLRGAPSLIGMGRQVQLPGAPATAEHAPSVGRAWGVTTGVIGLALLLLLIEAAERAGAGHTPRIGALTAGFVPAPLAFVVAFWLGVVLLAFMDMARAWIAAICATQLLFGVAALIETRAFAVYARQAELLPTMTAASSRTLVLAVTSFHTLTACLIGLAFAQIFAPWERVRGRGRQGAGGWMTGAMTGGVVALVVLNVEHGAILRLAAAGALGAGGRWLMDVSLTALVVALCAMVGGVVGWSLARDTR